jgi:proliferating cell nuclear antigen PCNA
MAEQEQDAVIELKKPKQKATKVAAPKKPRKKSTTTEELPKISIISDEIQQQIESTSAQEAEVQKKPQRGRGRPPLNKATTSNKDPVPLEIVQNNVDLSTPLPGYILWVRTTQSGIIKTLVEALKESIIETNIRVSKSMLRINEYDEQHKRVLIDMKLYCEKFEEFRVSKDYVFRVDIQNLYKLIKTMPTNSIITFFLEQPTNTEESDPGELGVIIENTEKQTKTTYKLTLPNVSSIKDYRFDENAEYESIDLSSTYFQKLCKDMKILSNKIEIKLVGDHLYLDGKSDFATQETKIKINKVSSDDSTVIQGIFGLDDITSFTKCSYLSKTMSLMLKNNLPLCLKYDIGSLGFIKIYISCL